jgi:hypothetical protein
MTKGEKKKIWNNGRKKKDKGRIKDKSVEYIRKIYE